MTKDFKVDFEHQTLYDWADIMVFQIERYAGSDEKYEIEMLIFVFLGVMIRLRKVG